MQGLNFVYSASERPDVRNKEAVIRKACAKNNEANPETWFNYPDN